MTEAGGWRERVNRSGTVEDTLPAAAVYHPFISVRIREWKLPICSERVSVYCGESLPLLSRDPDRMELGENREGADEQIL